MNIVNFHQYINHHLTKNFDDLDQFVKKREGLYTKHKVSPEYAKWAEIDPNESYSRIEITRDFYKLVTKKSLMIARTITLNDDLSSILKLSKDEIELGLTYEVFQKYMSRIFIIKKQCNDTLLYDIERTYLYKRKRRLNPYRFYYK